MTAGPSLFDESGSDAAGLKERPLADRLRPGSLAEVIGQEHLLGDGAPLRRMVEEGRLSSILFWGPPGCGKTTIARLLARDMEVYFEQISAVFSGVADLKKIFDLARQRSKPTLLFVDEIHRFNRAQQDAFLPYVEDGTVILIGATTENPSFALNNALLSRCRVFVLQRLSEADLEEMLRRAEEKLGHQIPLDKHARATLRAMADGDGRYLLNLVEQIAEEKDTLDSETLTQRVQQRALAYDKDREEHYNLISALHKSVRGSDPDAALYWLARMMRGGEDPRFLLRRITRMAVEDIGLAAPQGLPLCIAAWDAYERIGSPEGDLAIAEAVIYLATAPKSNAAYKAFNQARDDAGKTGSLMPPKNILNAPTKLMKDEGYGQGYVYEPNTGTGISNQDFFPDEMERRHYYAPKGDGFEHEIKQRLEKWATLRGQSNSDAQ